MKLGFLSAILDGWTYEEMMDVAHDMGFKCVEVACWPQGKAERRYAGVSHIDAERVVRDDEYARHIMDYAEKSGVQIWECRNCGHIVVGTAAPEVCPVCNHPQSYFEIKKENY